MSTNTYVIEYAKTGRSGCKDKDCKKSGNNKIDAGEMRIGKNSPNPFSQEEGDTKLDWYHPACWFATQTRMRAGSKKVEATDDLEGYDKLKADDKATVKDLIAGKGVGAKKAKAPAKKAAGKKRKAGSDDDDDEEEEKPKKKKAAPKKKKAAASDDDDDEGSDEEKPKKKKAKAAPKKKKAAASDDDDEGSDDEKPKKKAAPKKKAGGGGGGGDKKYYEMDEKFWEITMNDDSFTVRFGKIGANGTVQTKSFANAAAAEKEAAKLIRQKEGKGYELA